MPDDALSIIRAVASHPLLGGDAVIDRAATGGTTTTLVDTGLITYANDTSLRYRWVYLWSGANAGGERFVSSVALDTGTLTWGNAFGSAVASGDQYLLFREGRFSDWLNWINDTARAIYFDREVYLRGQTDIRFYTLPTPISSPSWIEQVSIGDYPFAFSNQDFPRKVDWYRLDKLNIEGDLYLVLENAITAASQLRFQVRVPYLHPHLSAYTMTRSVLLPFGETTAISVPREMMVAGVLWRALVEKERPLTGQARAVWTANRETAARWYAALLAQQGARLVGREQGYSSRW